MTTKTLLVTGATGKTGAKAANALLSAGHKVRALVHARDERSKRLEERGAEVVLGDFLDFQNLRAALQDVSVAYFCYPLRAGLVEASAYFAQAAQEHGVDAIVNMSQVTARPDATSKATVGHWVSERLFERSGVASIHLRPTFFFDWFRFFRQGITEGVLRLPFGPEGRVAFVDTDDLGRVVAQILVQPDSHKGRTYNLYGGEEVSFAEACAEFSRALGREIRYEQIPVAPFKEAIGKTLPPAIVQHFGEVAKDFAQGFFAGTNDVIEQITGRRPIGLRESVRSSRDEFIALTRDHA